ncbi:D-lactate dehydrogenase (cytochrome) [Halopenitus malekzadehii]|uniref:D-lactate dehydrogenase (cytochrome) n=1 Tax=Halopenitus malekzadehii TaxID=1267564 RepID=A0A1H6IRG6_9EURY|nr:FAD-binding oxidoreductase [Halopenitus malekzadehii]SEH50153.1 D-lactate dehydrogenase (cytochrome) [Halopenitus malekzadehii]
MDIEFLDDTSLSESQIATSDQSLEDHSSDWGTMPGEEHPPDVVVWPESTEDVSSVLAAANDRGIPVTPYAAGTSLEGHAVPVEGGISMNMTRMDDVLDVRPDDFQIDVQPGILGSVVDETVAEHGLFFPPLPSSGKISTIGGMIANDASGMQTVKYGEIHDWVLRLEAVLADGTVIETGSRASKTSAGYNLMDLLVGSEGTLAVVTEATLELAGIPEQIWGGRVVFPNRTEASAAIADAVRSGVDVAKIELIDELSAAMANRYLDADLPDVPMAFVEFHANHHVESEIEFFRSILAGYEVEDVQIAESGPEMERLWEVREEMASALKQYDPDLTMLTSGDVTVPISKYAELIDHISTLEAEHDLEIPCFGHAGDGNIHYTVMVRRDDPDHRALGERVDAEIVHHAIELGGTCTGEHGVGRGKTAYLPEEFNQATVDTMGRIKETMDPNGILNPGKLF